jgi:hypothetical protein
MRQTSLIYPVVGRATSMHTCRCTCMVIVSHGIRHVSTCSPMSGVRSDGRTYTLITRQIIPLSLYTWPVRIVQVSLKPPWSYLLGHRLVTVYEYSEVLTTTAFMCSLGQFWTVAPSGLVVCFDYPLSHTSLESRGPWCSDRYAIRSDADITALLHAHRHAPTAMPSHM